MDGIIACLKTEPDCQLIDKDQELTIIINKDRQDLIASRKVRIEFKNEYM